MDFFDRVKGALYGVAVGDALGVTLEFCSKETAKELGPHREIIGGGVFNFEPGEVSDDTQMTIAVLKGILRNPQDPRESIGEEFIEWHDSFPVGEGETISIAIKYFKLFRDWEKATAQAHHALRGKSAGNGSLMRTIPCVLAYEREEDVLRIAKIQSRLTHYDPLADEACSIYCSIGYKVLQGWDLRDAIKAVLEKEDKTCQYLRPIYTWGEEEFISTGFVVDTLRLSLYCLNTTDNFEDAVVKAVSYGGDADTQGAITGGLAGLYYGFGNIPKRWTAALSCKDKLDSLAKEVIGLRSSK